MHASMGQLPVAALLKTNVRNLPAQGTHGRVDATHYVTDATMGQLPAAALVKTNMRYPPAEGTHRPVAQPTAQ